MAATRAAELTVAYKTLTDPALRAEYDASIAAGLPPPHAAGARATRPSRRSGAPFRPPTIDEITPPPAGQPGRFASERADRDVILRRAIAGARPRRRSKRSTAGRDADGARLRPRHGAGGQAAVPRRRRRRACS